METDGVPRVVQQRAFGTGPIGDAAMINSDLGRGSSLCYQKNLGFVSMRMSRGFGIAILGSTLTPDGEHVPFLSSSGLSLVASR